ncbi:MAG: hypothetical protein P1P88_11500 [Bacteroidales bacterium]|nr:hypothetical protein [Bacteroidales bacterium]
MSKIATIKIFLNSEDMVKFYQKDPRYGSSNKPYKADDFCDVTAIGTTTTAYRNVFKLEPDTEYSFQLIETSPTTDFQAIFDNSSYVLSIIQENIPTEGEWSNIIDLTFNRPKIDENGNLIYSSVKDEKGIPVFNLKTQTANTLKRNNNLRYDINFRVKVVKDKIEEIRYAQIDPLIENTSEEPEP